MSSMFKFAIFIIILFTILNDLNPVFVLAAENEQETLSDYPDSQIGGPTSVGATLKSYEKQKDSYFEYNFLRNALRPYFDFKNGIKDKYGLEFSFDYHALIQTATESLGDNTAIGGVVRFFGRWELFNISSGNKSSIVYKVENRHSLGTPIAPQELGLDLGYLGLTSATFSDAGWLLTNFFWQQELFKGRFAIIFGVVDVTDYVDVYSMVDPWNAFSNLAFLNNPTIPAPNQGIGAAARILFTENIYILGGLADTNGDPSDPWNSVNTFFDQNEYFTHLEIGWIGSYESRFENNIHVTVWYADKREKKDVTNGRGVAVSFSRLLAERWLPFARAGYADGGGAFFEKSVSAGFGYYTQNQNGLFGFGINWGDPSNENFGGDLKDQHTAEMFYRMQLLNYVRITPDIQVLLEPALNPDKDVIFVFGLRAQVAL